jgi:hypothetical protein
LLRSENVPKYKKPWRIFHGICNIWSGWPDSNRRPLDPLSCEQVQLEPLVDAVPLIHGPHSVPRRRPGQALHADKGYDSQKNRWRMLQPAMG